MSNMDLSLLPSQAKFQMEKIRWKKRNRVAIGLISGVWMVIVVVAVLMNIVAKWQLSQIEKSISVANKTLAGMAEGIVNSQRLKYNAKLVGQVLEQRFEYGRAFKTIAKMFPEGITLDKYELKEKGLFSVTGQASGDKIILFEKIVENINSGRDERFESFTLKTLSLKNNNWTFLAEVVMK